MPFMSQSYEGSFVPHREQDRRGSDNEFSLSVWYFIKTLCWCSFLHQYFQCQPSSWTDLDEEFHAFFLTRENSNLKARMSKSCRRITKLQHLWANLITCKLQILNLLYAPGWILQFSESGVKRVKELRHTSAVFQFPTRILLSITK
jgi:hypothetical protein